MSDEPGTLAQTVHEMPWWVKAFMVVGNTFGFPIIMLGYYLGQDAGWIRNPVEERLAKIEADMQQDAGHAIRHDATMQEMVTHLDESMKRDQMRCILRANTDEEKKACFPSVTK